MLRVAVLPLSLVALLSGCTSLHQPYVKSDLYETQVRASQALAGDQAAFARLGELQATWAARGEQGWRYKLSPWDRANRDRAAQLASTLDRVIAGRDAILAQRDLDEVMVNALKDLESEYDAIAAMIEEAEASGAVTAADQKYLVRRMMHSLLQMSQTDMAGAVEAADTFGRDVTRFQQMLEAQINGDDELGIEPPSDPELEDSLAQVEELFTGYVADSSGDVLENVVARYDAWSALHDIAAIGDAVLVDRPAPAAGGEPAAPAPADGDASVDDEPVDVGAADAGAAQDDGAAAADDGQGAAVDEPGDEPADDASYDDEAAGALDDAAADDMPADDMPADDMPVDEAGADQAF